MLAQGLALSRCRAMEDAALSNSWCLGSSCSRAWDYVPTGIGAPPAFSSLHLCSPPIRMLPQCSSVPTSWTRKISLGSPTHSWCSTEATRMERESPATRHPLLGSGWAGGLGSTSSLCCLGSCFRGDGGQSSRGCLATWMGWWGSGQPPSQQCPLGASVAAGGRCVGGGGVGKRRARARIRVPSDSPFLLPHPSVRIPIPSSPPTAL